MPPLKTTFVIVLMHRVVAYQKVITALVCIPKPVQKAGPPGDTPNLLCRQVLTYAPVEAGMEVVHYMYPAPFGSSLKVMGGKGLRARGPRLLSKQDLFTDKEWKKCVLRIVDAKVTPRPLTL